MKNRIRTLIAAASLALLASCASTGENTEETAQDATAQQGVAGQPGQEAYSYPYGQAPSGYDTYDTSGGGLAAAGGPAGGRAGQAVSADRIVYFEYDSAEIRPDSQGIIEANARALTGNRRTVTQLEGHTDERGSREYNVALGERRALAVRAAMIAAGIDSARVQTRSYGEERPVAFGHDESAWRLNRRAEFVFTQM